MYNRENLILEQYPFEVRQTVKGRGALICDTDKGLKILKEYKGSEGRADFLYGLLQFLKNHGQERIDCIVKTGDAKTIARDADGTAYMVRDWYEGRECDTKSRDDILKSIRQLADIHNVLREFPEEIPEYLQVRDHTLLEENERHTRELKKVRNFIFSRKKKTDFEMEFLKSYDIFYKEALEVVELQKQEQKREEDGEKEGVYGICHGDYNQHNVLFSRQGIAVLNFEKASYDIQASDLGNFMRKILEKHNWNMGLGMDMLSAYHKVRALSEQEMKQLYIRLAYPEKFWKIANHYFNTSKAWVCGRNLEKLEKFISQNEARESFLHLMWKKA
ncbi:CotS family spore coat protein [Petralouisia muris]|uniref:CotS family spore coat protein n=1 Tax=Petralouisia muris TaxID=3032872 RepID=A0AC61RRY4_9FIRM|nr:CotS family spore coat protein [Petralouisia muris]TGY91983.1 CotS family spore coat protein [Petralouisia muris]